MNVRRNSGIPSASTVPNRHANALLFCWHNKSETRTVNLINLNLILHRYCCCGRNEAEQNGLQYACKFLIFVCNEWDSPSFSWVVLPFRCSP